MRKIALFGWMRRHPIWSVLIALGLGLIIYKVATPTKPTYEYVAEPAQRGDVTRVVSASGKVRALNTIKVGAEISGQVSRVFVDYNSPVVAGQPLAEIDSTRVAARVTQAEAQVQLARASLVQAEAALARARTDIEIQSRDYARRKELTERGFTSRTGLDQSANAVAAARGGLQSAAAGVVSARAQIRQREAELQSARLDLSRTRILAPASGTVINKLVEPGATGGGELPDPEPVRDRGRHERHAGRSVGGRGRHRRSARRPAGAVHRRCLSRPDVRRARPPDPDLGDRSAECGQLFRDPSGPEPGRQAAARHDRERGDRDRRPAGGAAGARRSAALSPPP
jgi:biotin carboxyl carrier protein